MTQRKWNTEDGWSVLTGWDRPLQHFFVTIDRECGGCDGEGIVTDGFGGTPEDPRDCNTCDGEGIEYLFNNLNDNTGLTTILGGMSLDQVKAVLDQKLTWYPDTLIGDLATDKANNAGNQVDTYATRGVEKEG